jgi:GNAT superfamily N-acetyltransferase
MGMMPITVLPLAAEDYAAWLPLWRGYQAFYNVDIEPDVTAATWARLMDAAAPMDGVLAWRARQAVGLAHTVRHLSTWSIAEKCYLNDLFVSPDIRGQGIGRALIAEVYARAAAAGCGAVYWLTHETNATAMRLYDGVATRSGFVQYSRALP